MIKRDIHASRLLLQNQYAHIEELESQASSSQAGLQPPMVDHRHAAPLSAERLPRHSLREIEQAAIGLQRKLWVRRAELGVQANAHPVDVLRAEHAAKLLGYSYDVADSLGRMRHGRNQIRVAGLINRTARRVIIASDVDPREARFTAAHEIGHIVLHPHQTGLHRDRPLTGTNTIRDQTEYEADKFAAYFLMPRKLVSREFMSRFIAARFSLSEESAYALWGRSSRPEDGPMERRQLARELASAIQYNGRTFSSLTDVFGVNIEAMAIRLEELRLV